MQKIELKNIQDNLVDLIANEWMLVTAGTPEKFNTMTANWGGVGYLWNKPVVFVFVRPERYTYEFTEANDLFTLSFVGEENKDIHKVCGTKSGRDIDKIKETGLLPVATERGSVTFQQSRLTLECRKLYKDVIKEDNFLDKEIYSKWYNFAKGEPHEMYVAEVLNVWIND